MYFVYFKEPESKTYFKNKKTRGTYPGKKLVKKCFLLPGE